MGRLLQARQVDIAVSWRRTTRRDHQAWLAINHGVTYPTDQSHLTDFLQVRLSEPCNRGSLKITHESFVFLDIFTGREAQQRLTASQLCLGIYRELLSKALPGKPTKQAPRMFTKMLSCLEQLIMSSIFPWWILVQSWATPRFDDHRDINQKSIKVDSTSFTALLTRSKTIGDDKAVHSRPLIIDAACYLHSKDWMHTGWTLLADTANFERDFLLPAPSTNYHGVVHSELRYAIAYAMQNRVLSSISIDGSGVFSFPVTHYWTPHSSRSYLPSATLLLDFPTLQRDCLGGWNAQASDRYVRTACRSIINMQRAFIRAVHSAKPDSLAEQDLADDFEEFLQSNRVPPDSIAKCLSNLRSPIRSRDLSDTADQPAEDQPAPQPPVVPGPADPSVPFRPAKRQKPTALRTEILGSNPKARRKYGLFTGSATAAHCRTSTTWTTAT